MNYTQMKKSENQIRAWISRLPAWWNDWKRDFNALSEQNQAYFIEAVQETGINDYVAFLDYMESH